MRPPPSPPPGGAATTWWELACRQNRPGRRLEALSRIFRIQNRVAKCRVGTDLKEKYGLARPERQDVVGITNRVSGQQCWYNGNRKNKPQTFRSENKSSFDPTSGGGVGRCDFCEWEKYTAEDSFGRIENRYAVTASNLFKFNQYHGLVLFKHHQPLQFDFQQLGGMLDAAWEWLDKTHEHSQRKQKEEMHPLIIWNCLPRSGASQYHGHAQTLLSPAPFPEQTRLLADIVRYKETHQGRDYLMDLLDAHTDAGLTRCIQDRGESAFCYASLTPLKDKEIVVQGKDLGSLAFRRMLYTSLRALIDCMGVETFNLVIQNISLETHCLQSDRPPVMARMVSRGSMQSKASDFGALEVFAGASLAHTDPYEVIQSVDKMAERIPWTVGTPEA